MPNIEVSHLSFAYDGSYDNVFDDVSLSISTDWKLGFCGRNGRGKTTFLRLLLGGYEYTGRITADAVFEYFPYVVPDATLNTLEILESKASADTRLWRVQKELSKLGVDEGVLYRPFHTLSNGERVKVLLAGLFLCENAFPLIDEPTDHLDAAGREAVARYLNAKRGFILVSHDRALLDACTDHTLAINKRNIELIKGSFSVWWEQKSRQDAFEVLQNAKLSKEIARLNETAKRTSGWAEKTEKSKRQPQKSGNAVDTGYIGHKAARMMKRAGAAEKRRQESAAQKAKLLKNIESADALKLSPLDYFSERLVSVNGLCIKYDEKIVCENVCFEITAGERTALSGGNGSGKSSVIKLICGENIPHEGDVKTGSGLVVSYVPQDVSGLKGNLSDYARGYAIEEPLFKAVLRKLGFERAQFDKELSDFSAGQKKKVSLARSLCERAHLYVWDEPLNYVDVFARMQIEDLILAYRPTLLFVEHDQTFCGRISTKRVVL